MAKADISQQFTGHNKCLVITQTQSGTAPYYMEVTDPELGFLKRIHGKVIGDSKLSKQDRSSGDWLLDKLKNVPVIPITPDFPFQVHGSINVIITGRI